jgi:hypothetical protein
MSLQDQIARINEQRLKVKLETYKNYIYNALAVIQERELFDDKMLREYALTELGIIKKDFNDIMGKEYGV